MRRAALPLAAALLVAGLTGAPTAANAAAAASRPLPTQRPLPAQRPLGAHRRATPAARLRDHHVVVAAPAGRRNARRAAVGPATRLDPTTRLLRPATNGTVTVTVLGARDAVAARSRALGGRVLAASGGMSSVLIVKSRLAALAAADGVSAVRTPVRAFADTVTSEGVAASNADSWHTAHQTGGIDVGIVDIGFAGLAAAKTAGNLPSDTQITNENCTVNGTASTETDPHGTAVAEILSQMAPAAHLHLYCITDTVGLADAEAAIQADPAITIVSSSLGFPNDSRGDGTGGSCTTPTTAAGVVCKARRAGILWVSSAGNSAADHWHGTLADTDADGLADVGGVFDAAKDQYEDDTVFIAPGNTNAPSSADIDLQWDQWPTSTGGVTLEAYGYQCTNAFVTADCGAQPINPDSAGYPQPLTVTHASGTAPTASIQLHNTQGFDQYWQVDIAVSASYATTRYDLTYEGDVDGPSVLACATAVNNECVIAAGSYQGSISSPANSPYALAVGAADVGTDGTARGTLENFSSQGPTIDRRVKPEITGWDGVSSPVYGSAADTANPGGFYGTSAAAPHVAGAAALVKAANPSFDAAQLQDFLQRRASKDFSLPDRGVPSEPPTNAMGYGLLTLGDPASVTAPTAADYQSITPLRVLDTRTTTGGHHAPLGTGGTVTLTLANLPSDATAVAINLTGVGATQSTYLSAYPGGTAFPGTSNLNLSTTDPTAAVFTIVTVRNRAITIHNAGGTLNVVVDELGYFGTGVETGTYTPLRPAHRVLDTRTTTGGHHSKLLPGAGVIVNAGVAGASAAVVNVTTADTTKNGYVSAAPTCSSTSSTLNFTTYTRANLAIVKLSAAGTFCVTDGSSAADVIVDVVGTIGANGAGYVALPAAQRIIDTRFGTGGSAGGHASLALDAATSTAFRGSAVGIVPASATALFTGVVEADATASSGYLGLFAGDTRPSSPSSNINFTAGRVVANAAIVGLTNDDFGIYNSAGSTNVAVDLFGYFVPRSV